MHSASVAFSWQEDQKKINQINLPIIKFDVFDPSFDDFADESDVKQCGSLLQTTSS